jgi:hypothetical protein
MLRRLCRPIVGCRSQNVNGIASAQSSTDPLCGRTTILKPSIPRRRRTRSAASATLSHEFGATSATSCRVTLGHRRRRTDQTLTRVIPGCLINTKALPGPASPAPANIVVSFPVSDVAQAFSQPPSAGHQVTGDGDHGEACGGAGQPAGERLPPFSNQIPAACPAAG